MVTPNISIPADVDAEICVLGSILLDPGALYLVDLEAHEFYLERHALIYEALRAIARDGKNIDLVTLSATLTERDQLEKVGGSAYLVQLSRSVPSIYHVKTYAEAVRRAHIKRQIIQAATEIVGMAYHAESVETTDLKARALGRILKVDAPTTGEVVRLDDAIAQFMPTFNEYVKRKQTVWGIPTGLDLDKYTGGLQSGDLWIVAGYPGHGKTSLAMNIARRVAADNHAVLFFTLEMSVEKLMLRFFSELGNVSSEDIRRGKINSIQRDGIMEAVSAISPAPLYLVETSQSMDSIRARLAGMQAAGQAIKLVVIDYLRLLKDRADNEILKTANICRAAKLLARDYGVTVMLIHSLNRQAAGRAEGPNLQSLSYAGDYDADVVAITHFADDRMPEDKTASINIAKNRSGRTGDVPMIYLEEQTRWANPAR